MSCRTQRTSVCGDFLDGRENPSSSNGAEPDPWRDDGHRARLFAPRPVADVGRRRQGVSDADLDFLIQVSSSSHIARPAVRRTREMETEPRPPYARPFAREAWRLLLPYWQSDERWRAFALLAAIVVLNLGAVYILVLLNAWNRSFYDALQQRDAAAFAGQLGRFCLLAAAFIVSAVYRQYLTQVLEMRWRRWLTHHFLHAWLDGGAYYRLERAARETDNPDQRIAEDLRALAGGTLTLATGLLNAVVTLVSFVGILWSLSGPLAIPLGGAR